MHGAKQIIGWLVVTLLCPTMFISFVRRARKLRRLSNGCSFGELLPHVDGLSWMKSRFGRKTSLIANFATGKVTGKSGYIFGKILSSQRFAQGLKIGHGKVS